MRAIRLLVAKDLRLEWRTREIVTAMGLLALILVIVFGATRSDQATAPVAMWITYAFGASLGFARTFGLEGEHLTALRLASVDGTAIIVGKTVANWLLLVVVQIVSLPIFGAIFTERIWSSLPLLAVPIVLGGVGLAVVGTLFGAIVAQTRLREVLLPLLMLPLVLPVLIAAVGATSAVLDGQPLPAIRPQLQLLGAFDMLFAAMSLLLFDALVEE